MSHIIFSTILVLLFLRPPSNHSFQIPQRPHRLFTTTSTTTLHSTTTNNNNNPSTTTPAPKYPTTRGSPVDPRLIVPTDPQTLLALHLSHILFLSDELAQQSLRQLRSASTSFSELASQISHCRATRDEGGQIGWMTVPSSSSSSSDDDPNGHLDDILPLVARRSVLRSKAKPGDILHVPSPRGHHLVQIRDVMVDVRSNAVLKPRRVRKDGSTGGVGILAGGLLDKKEENGRVLRYKIETMGCQMNLADSERMEGQLKRLGMVPIGEEEEGVDPDLVVLNTCSIRDHAEQKVYSYIGPHAKRKRNGSDVAIIVAGCVAQQEGENLLRRAPEVDLVMGPQYANRLVDLLEDVANGNQVVATEASHIMEDSTKPRRSSKTCAWVNIIYGCNERCTYCVVPTTRGVEQSRPSSTIIAEIQNLVDAGYKEVTLLGQNIDAYGRDLRPKRKFSDLLRAVGDGVPELKRLRFVTSHPRYMSLGVVDAVAEVEGACECFHVPFQSGSDEVLGRMGRGHTREAYLQIIDRIRTRLPDAAITADVIVGFPGETESQFLETLSLMSQVKFDSVNTAAYSPRPNTPAATWPDQISDDVKQDRLRRINELNIRHATERRRRMQGRVVEVLVEERNVKIPTQVMGRTRHGYIVYFEGGIEELRGRLVMVEIESCHTYHLVGRVREVLED